MSVTNTDNASTANTVAEYAGIFGQVTASLKAHLLVLLIPLSFLAFSTFMLGTLSDPQRIPVYKLIVTMVTLTLPTAMITAFVIRMYQYITVIKPESPSKQLLADIKHLILFPPVLLNALPAIIAMIIHNKAAIELKAAIPALKPFSWDQTFIDMDRWMHFGVDPWRILQPVLGFAPVTFMLNNAYNFWFVLMFSLWAYFAFQPKHNALRERFFVSFFLCWLIGGGIMALMFSSAGPVYLANLGFTNNPFTALMAYLNDVNDNIIALWALDAQQLLWDGYTGKKDLFLGISAFPSMHNACVALFACAAWSLNRTFGKVLIAYAVIILLGSVHLGWHYAVDGYAGIALALLCWWLAGHLVRWHQKQPWMQHYNNMLRSQYQRCGN